MPGMATVYSYIRFSTPQQIKGDSLRRQLEGTAEWARANGHTLSPHSFRDLGVSAFAGKNATHGKLRAFLAAVEEDRIKPGSILAVENLDRLSRDQVTSALSLFLDILGAGITVYTTMDKKTYSFESVNKNPMDLMLSILIMSRAREESETKSARLSAKWQQRRKAAAEKKTPATGRCPGWVELRDGKFVLIPDRAETMRKVIRLALDGHGFVALAKRLNRDNVPSISRHPGTKWDGSTLRHVLRTRTLIGEFQPQVSKDGKRVNVGDPVPGYFPALLKESEFYALQGVIARRSKVTRGRPSEEYVNLFGGLTFDADTGCTFVMHYCRPKNGNGKLYAYLCPSSVDKGERKPMYPYPEFETAFLQWVQEVDLDSLNPKDQTGRLTELQTKLAALSDKLQRISKALADSEGDEFSNLVELVKSLEGQKQKVSADLEAERQKTARPKIDTADIGAIVRKLRATKNGERADLRRRLRAAVCEVVRRIDLRVVYKGWVRVAVATVRLADDTTRMFTVRVRRDQPSVSYSDAHKWQGDPTLPDLEFLASCDSPDAALEFMHHAYPWPVTMRRLPAE